MHNQNNYIDKKKKNQMAKIAINSDSQLLDFKKMPRITMKSLRLHFEKNNHI